MGDPIPALEPLIRDLKDLLIGDYLKSNDFKRFCIKVQIADFWKTTFTKVEKSRTFISLGMDHEKYDQEDTLTEFLNDAYRYNEEAFYQFTLEIVHSISIGLKKKYQQKIL